jgi:glyoxylase-like metal-dependent hydrolase (beta-lactamase superfamily II)
MAARLISSSYASSSAVSKMMTPLCLGVSGKRFLTLACCIFAHSLSWGNFGRTLMSNQTRRDLLVMTTLAAGATALGATSAWAQGARTGEGAPPVFRYKIGSFEVMPILDGIRSFPLPPTFVANADIEDVQTALSEAMRPEGIIENPFTPTLIRTSDKLVLIDTGNGPQDGASPVGHLVENMRQTGMPPEQVDLVIISHFHPDHIAGLKTADGEAMFPNAEVAVPEREMAFWLDEAKESRAAEGRRPNFALARRMFGDDVLSVRTYDDGDEITPGITAVAAYGHSPGHMAFRIESDAQQLLLLSDAAHLPFLFVRNPDWALMFDMDPETARESRRRLLEEAATDHVLVAGYHWGFPNVGHIRRTGDGYELVRMPWPS